MDDNLAKIAAERIAKARAELILSRHVLWRARRSSHPDRRISIPTMATNGKQHFCNPAFIATLSQENLLAVQAHESEHDARRHHTRRGGRDPVKWNEATDYGINIDLVDAGFKLPEGALIDPKYRGMSAEDIYRSLRDRRSARTARTRRARAGRRGRGRRRRHDEGKGDEPEANDEERRRRSR